MSDDHPRDDQGDPPTWAGQFGVPGDQELRYRVVEVLHIDPDTGKAVSGDIREFKTRPGAEDCLDRWVKAGKSAVLQWGLLRWAPGDEDPQAVLGMTDDKQ